MANRVLPKILKPMCGDIDHFRERFGRLHAHEMKLWFLEGFTESLLPHLGNSSTSPNEIICFATFPRLDLTHTCCNIGGYAKKNTLVLRRSRKSATKNAELEELAAAFETEYKELGISLAEFLEGHWSTKMDEFLHRESALDEEEVKGRDNWASCSSHLKY